MQPPWRSTSPVYFPLFGERRLPYGRGMREEQERVSRLLAAQANAVALFDEVTARGVIAAGLGEQAASDRIRDLANEMFGTTKHWHKRIVRSGPHTLQPYRENPPDRVIEADDIVFADFGPIFEEFEADLGRTYVLGDDPDKRRLAADLPVIFTAGRRYFAGPPGITGAELYAEIARLAREAGWSLGGTIAGHLVGEFPHEKIDGADVESYIIPGNTTPMHRADKAGRACHWILEIHLVDTAGQFGGFYEQLLDLG
jgi:Xaa-Pro aminopeptidase